MRPLEIQQHHDGFGLNDKHIIQADPRDPKAGNASHRYEVVDDTDGDVPATIWFQHGPRGEPGSESGVLDASILAILIDRYEGFQSGPFACSENEVVLGHLRGALAGMKAHAIDRSRRGVLGTSKT